jgi:hypothetical protein
VHLGISKVGFLAIWSISEILHHWQERVALLPMVRVSTTRRIAETRLMRKVQDLSYASMHKLEGLD